MQIIYLHAFSKDIDKLTNRNISKKFKERFLDFISSNIFLTFVRVPRWFVQYR